MTAPLEDVFDVEDRDGVRLSWNVWPTTTQHESKMVVPMAVVYTPLKKTPQPPPLLQYDPVYCRGPCKTILNPFCSVDIPGRLWVCPFCYQRNQFPPRYGNLQNQPPELVPQFTTVEYRLSKPYAPPPVFLFVVDVATYPEELQHIRESLMMALSVLPENCQVGLITFAQSVKLYELSFEACPKAYVFNGGKPTEVSMLSKMLGLAADRGAVRGPGPQGQQPNAPTYRFMLPLKDCELTIEGILEDLQTNPSPTKPGHREVRCTGAAISVAVGLLETLRLHSAARIMCFMSGPCTVGPGKVVNIPKAEHMRMHLQLEKDTAPFVKSATAYYDTLSKRCSTNGHVVDLFAGCLDQVGIMEMRSLVEKTGGILVNSASFDHAMFKDSFRKIFSRDANGNLNMGFNVSMDVQMSRELKVMGGIGHFTSAEKKSACVSDREVGESNTSGWKTCSIDPFSSFAFYFSIVNQQQPPKRTQRGMIQLTTSYTDSTGAHILRVSTIARPFVTGGVPGANPQDMSVNAMNHKVALSVGFDQEAAAVLMARLAVFKARKESLVDIIRWLDRSLINLAKQFGEFEKGIQQSFRLGRQFGLYPQFMFHLRRSCLLQNFNYSPDESTYFRYMPLRENAPNSMTMIQPRLEAYTFQQHGEAVLLSSTSLAPDRILVLDTFFHVVVWHGKKIAEWKNKRFQDDPNYASFKALLEAPINDAKSTVNERVPTPMFCVCDVGQGDERYLIAVVDPAKTYSSTSAVQQEGEIVATDDVNLQVFMDHLKKLAVKP
eukprot:CAMPEP_0119129606 /NCGR_PEP_ID=MMETSP1310-20130426/7282_1 /TAXON_ID=464262 /ORGANISM="Genus nov. species nov., Strain RCC2339" /LENGTH=774 /DNA_ID=CAMNT_0007120039 /DNA_START=261 /DNA_END=2588 /DNA_ORIENTATION=+